uniref:DUF748 domain-containing protein n=1 Tax=Desulfobacter sp. UBA2225 TaxID=1961413 RepID=UPI00257DA40C
MKKYFTVKIVALSAVILFALYLILTGLVVPWAGKRIAVNALTKTLERQTRIESITFNPFTLEARVKNFVVESKIKGENLASIQDVYLNLSAASLLHLAPVISDVQVTAPKFSLHLNEDNSLNISDLLEGNNEPTAPEPEPAKEGSDALFEFKVFNVKITDAALVFTDHIRSVTHSVTQLNFDLPLISSMEKDLATPIKAVMNCLVNNSRLDVNVTGVPFDATRKMSLSLSMLPLDLNYFVPYINLPAPYKIKSAGNLVLSVSGEYEIPAGKTVEDQKLALNLQTLVKNFDLENVSGADLFVCPLLKVDASSQNVFDMNFLVDEVLLDQASLFVERDARGGINVVPGGQGMKTAQPPEASTRTSDASTVDTQGVQGQEPAVQENKKPLKPVIALSLPFTAKINQAAVKNMHIRFSDKMISPEMVKEISSLDFSLTDMNVGSKVEGKYDLHILTGDDEEIKTAGEFHVHNDLTANGNVSVNGISLKNFRPYLAPYLGDNVTLENVAAALNFNMGFSQAGLGVEVSDGQVTLDTFGLTEQGKKEPLVQFDRLALSGISCDLLKQEAGVRL